MTKDGACRRRESCACGPHLELKVGWGPAALAAPEVTAAVGIMAGAATELGAGSCLRSTAPVSTRLAGGGWEPLGPASPDAALSDGGAGASSRPEASSGCFLLQPAGQKDCMAHTKKRWILPGISLKYCASLDASCEFVMKCPCPHLCTGCILFSGPHTSPEIISSLAQKLIDNASSPARLTPSSCMDMDMYSTARAPSP